MFYGGYYLLNPVNHYASVESHACILRQLLLSQCKHHTFMYPSAFVTYKRTLGHRSEVSWFIVEKVMFVKLKNVYKFELFVVAKIRMSQVSKSRDRCIYFYG
jgi:hypothetical protein